MRFCLTKNMNEILGDLEIPPATPLASSCKVVFSCPMRAFGSCLLEAGEAWLQGRLTSVSYLYFELHFRTGAHIYYVKELISFRKF